ncbi:MAG: hypothetical protein II177_06760 [Lachnospiraceae bacterium]|jgi:uncharacterized protein|nr:hypothetical protein [Lachnospiraceae bacterium]
MDYTAEAEVLTGKNRDYQIIEEYGRDIIGSNDFRRIVGQRHHIFSTVGYHSVHVAQKMLFLSRFFHMNERDIVRASLWHDVGIFDRKSFRGTSGTAHEHPLRSLKAAEESGTLNDTQADMIANHMWPVTAEMPKTREGILITIADKWCAVTEFLNFHDDRIDEVLETGETTDALD